MRGNLVVGIVKEQGITVKVCWPHITELSKGLGLLETRLPSKASLEGR